MVADERMYIRLCKEQIEKKFAFGNGTGYSQRDLELLAQHIEEKTAVHLSLSTLKRLWKGDFKERPQIATLNALAAVLDYKDWQEFKLQNQPSLKHFTKKPPRVLSFTVLFLILAGTLMLINLTGKENRPEDIKVNGPVHFSARKTVTSGIPNTVIFNYDLKHVEADSFFFQQSWNDFHKVAIDRNHNFYTSIYYQCGYHRAKLIANDSVIAIQPVHILSDGWEPYVYYNYKDQEAIGFKNERFIANGRLHLSEELLHGRNVDFTRDFFTKISNIRKFNVSSSNFSLVSRIKADSLKAGLCPWMQVRVITEKHIFWVNLQNKGCERNASYKTGEIIRHGEDNDLSALGVKTYDWQDVGIAVEDKNAEIRLNGKTVFRETFKEDFGEIMGLVYMFDGTGSIDYVKMTDANGETVFEDDFTYSF